MFSGFNITQDAKLVEGLPPAADAGGRTGAYISLKNAAKVYVIAQVNQGNAAQVTLTPYQASDVSGTGAKVTGALPISVNQDQATNDTLAAQTAAANFQTSVALKRKLVVFEIDPSALDVANGFDCIRVDTGASNAANITSIMYVLVGLRYSQATPPTAVVD